MILSYPSSDKLFILFFFRTYLKVSFWYIMKRFISSDKYSYTDIFYMYVVISFSLILRFFPSGSLFNTSSLLFAYRFPVHRDRVAGEIRSKYWRPHRRHSLQSIRIALSVVDFTIRDSGPAWSLRLSTSPAESRPRNWSSRHRVRFTFGLLPWQEEAGGGHRGSSPHRRFSPWSFSFRGISACN